MKNENVAVERFQVEETSLYTFLQLVPGFEAATSQKLCVNFNQLKKEE